MADGDRPGLWPGRPGDRGGTDRDSLGSWAVESLGLSGPFWPVMGESCALLWGLPAVCCAEGAGLRVKDSARLGQRQPWAVMVSQLGHVGRQPRIVVGTDPAVMRLGGGCI